MTNFNHKVWSLWSKFVINLITLCYQNLLSKFVIKLITNCCDHKLVTTGLAPLFTIHSYLRNHYHRMVHGRWGIGESSSHARYLSWTSCIIIMIPESVGCAWHHHRPTKNKTTKAAILLPVDNDLSLLEEQLHLPLLLLFSISRAWK